MDVSPVALGRTRRTGVGPLRAEDIDQYSTSAVRSAKGFHSILVSTWKKQEPLRLILKREFPRIAGYLIFKGREVPQDATLSDAIEQCAPGGLVLVHGTHAAHTLNLHKPLRIEGVGSGAQTVLLRARFVVKPRRCRHSGPQQVPPMMNVQLHNIHMMQPAGERSAGNSTPSVAADSEYKRRDPNDVDKALPDPKCSLLWVGARARVQATRCLFEEAPDSSCGCGIFVDTGGRLEAVDSAVKNAADYGLVTSGVAKLRRCRVVGSKVGARMTTVSGVQLVLKDCILKDNRDIGIYLPPLNDFRSTHARLGGRFPALDESSWPFRCTLKRSTVSRSWYPVAQKVFPDTRWERHPWVEPPEQFGGLQMDRFSRLQALAEADYDRNADADLCY